MGNATHQPLQSLLELLRGRYGQEGVVEDGREGQPEGPEGVQQQGEREDLPEGLGAVDHLDVLEKRIFTNMVFFYFFSIQRLFCNGKEEIVLALNVRTISPEIAEGKNLCSKSNWKLLI